MSITFDEIANHVGHEVIVVGYGRHGKVYAGVAIECVTCDCALLEWDRPSEPVQSDPKRS